MSKQHRLEEIVFKPKYRCRILDAVSSFCYDFDLCDDAYLLDINEFEYIPGFLLLRYKNFGRNSLFELKRALSEYGVQLGSKWSPKLKEEFINKAEYKYEHAPTNDWPTNKREHFKWIISTLEIN